MPLPFIVGAIGAKILLGATVATGVAGAAKGVQGAMKSSEANDVQGQAERLITEAQKNVEDKREVTSQVIIRLGETKLKASASEINDFVRVFSRIKDVDLKESIGLTELKKLNIKDGMLGEMKAVALGANELMQSGLASVGAAALLGWGTYGGVMALGTASTGAAIGGLSGIAATNATLAWLGGGAIAAGGGGMALGTAVLGGIVAGPALLVAGGIYGAKAKAKLNNAKSNLAEARQISEELITAEKELEVIAKKAKQFNLILRKMVKQLRYTIEKMNELTFRKIDWNQYTEEEKSLVAMAVKYAQITKGMIDMQLLTEGGILTKEINQTLNDSELKNLANQKLSESFD